MSKTFNINKMKFNPVIASAIGVAESIVLEQIHYWLEKNKREGRNQKEGFTWTYNSIANWTKQFSFYSESTVKRTFKKLVKLGVLITGNFNKKSYDKTLWYRIDYQKLDSITEEFLEEEAMVNMEQEPSENLKSDRPNDEVNLIQPIPKTNNKQNNTLYQKAKRAAKKAFSTFKNYEQRCYNWNELENTLLETAWE